MRFYSCAACKTSFQVAGDLKEMQGLWEVLKAGGSLSCPTPLCQGRLVQTTHHVKGFTHKEIPLPTFYRGVHGFGSPDGEAATLEKFRDLIMNGKIVEVHAEPVGQPERVILKRLILEDGTRLHFDTSARGACCYYIEQPGPSCLEVVENELTNVDTAEAADEGSNTDREEVGRAAENENWGESIDESIRNIHRTAATELSRAASVPTVPTTCEVPTSPDAWAKRGGDHTH